MELREHPITGSEARLLISELQQQVRNLEGGVATLQTRVTTITSPTIPSGSTPQAVNQIRNGTYSHSVNSWDNVVAANNGRYECAWWYSHPVLPGQPMYKGNNILTDPTLTITSVSGDVITIADNYLITGMAVTFTGSLPLPLVSGTIYYIIRIDNNTFYVASSYANATAGTRIALTTTTSGGTLTFNYTLKDDSHTQYSEGFSDWDIPTGSARFTHSSSDISCFLPGRNVEAGYLYSAVFTITKTSPYVSAPVNCRLFCGLYGYSIADTEWNWLKAPYEMNAQVLGTITTPTEREYMIYVETDRGISLSTTPELVSSAPSNADYAAGAAVFLSWPRPLGYGVTTYFIYRRTPTDFVPGDVTGNVITIPGIRLTTGQPIQFTGADLPDPLVASTVYYAIRLTDNTFEVAATESDALANIPIPLTDAGTGTHTLQVYLMLYPSTGVSYIDNNSFATFATGYPVADHDELVAYTATIPNVVTTLPYSGDPTTAGWVTIPLDVRMPSAYNKADTDLDKGQWLRWGLTAPLDLRTIDGFILFGTSTFTDFTASVYTTDLIGKTVTITGRGATLVTTITGVPSPNELQLADPWMHSNALQAVAVITDGAPPHSLMIDLSHLTWIRGAGFSPNPEDISPLRGNPAAVPNGTTQPPIIVGQLPTTPDGSPICLFEDEMLVTSDGEIPAKDVQIGMALPDGYGGFNTVEMAEQGVADVWTLKAENGASLLATETKQIFVEKDVTRTLAQLNVGDTVLTVADGEISPSPIAFKSKVFEKRVVIKIGLSPNHSFLAGSAQVKMLISNQKPLPFPEQPQVI